jgi:heat shock protein HslJ
LKEKNMKPRQIVTLLVGVAVLALAACGPQASASLEATSWVLTELGGSPPVQGTEITVQFAADGNLGGSGGCNSYGATYAVDGSQLTISQVVSTMMACDTPIMDQETQYFTALGSTASYTISGETLTLSDSAGASLAVFAAGQPTPDLAGTSWLVMAYDRGENATTPVISGTDLTAEFGDDGNVTGSSGCNDFFAPYTQEGASITIGAVGSTRMSCPDPDGIMQQEAQYLAALQSATSIEASGIELNLRNADGELVVVLAATP